MPPKVQGGAKLPVIPLNPRFPIKPSIPNCRSKQGEERDRCWASWVQLARLEGPAVLHVCVLSGESTGWKLSHSPAQPLHRKAEEAGVPSLS